MDRFCEAANIPGPMAGTKWNYTAIDTAMALTGASSFGTKTG
jgi:hypothetical protein